MGGELLQNYELPKAARGSEGRLTSEVVIEINFDIDDLTKYAKENKEKILPDQKRNL